MSSGLQSENYTLTHAHMIMDLCLVGVVSSCWSNDCQPTRPIPMGLVTCQTSHTSHSQDTGTVESE